MDDAVGGRWVGRVVTRGCLLGWRRATPEARGTRARGRGAVVVICGFCVRARSVPFGVVRAFVRRGEDGRARRLSNVSINSVRVSTGRVSCRLGRTARRKPLARPTTVAT